MSRTIETYHCRWSKIFIENVSYPLSRAKYMAVLAAYFDESGMHGSARVTLVAGLLARKQHWIQFDKEWRQLLKSYKVRILHMNTFNGSRGDFQGWDRQKKIKFQGLAISIIRANTQLLIGHVLKRHEFNQVKDNHRVTNISPYQLCAVQCITALSHWASQSITRRPIDVYFEQGNTLSNDALVWFQASDSRQTMIEGITLTSKESATPLQAADFFAYQLYRHHVDQHQDFPPSTRRSFDLLVFKRKYVGIMNTPESLTETLDLILRTRQHIKTHRNLP